MEGARESRASERGGDDAAEASETLNQSKKGPCNQTRKGDRDRGRQSNTLLREKESKTKPSAARLDFGLAFFLLSPLALSDEESRDGPGPAATNAFVCVG